MDESNELLSPVAGERGFHHAVLEVTAGVERSRAGPAVQSLGTGLLWGFSWIAGEFPVRPDDRVLGEALLVLQDDPGALNSTRRRRPAGGRRAPALAAPGAVTSP